VSGWKLALEKVWHEAAQQVAQQLEVHTNPEVLREDDISQVQHVCSSLDIASLEFSGAARFTAATRTHGNGVKPRRIPTRFTRCVKVAKQLSDHKQWLYGRGLEKCRLVDEMVEQARVAVEGAMHTIIWQLASGHPAECVCGPCLTAKVEEESVQSRADSWFREYTGGFKTECGG
jgi:hypothetical protein